MESLDNDEIEMTQDLIQVAINELFNNEKLWGIGTEPLVFYINNSKYYLYAYKVNYVTDGNSNRTMFVYDADNNLILSEL